MITELFFTAATLAGAAGAPGVAPAADSAARRHAKRLAPAVVTITARDYAFDAPDSIGAGVTTLHLVNRGPDLHHVAIVKLGKGKTVTDFFDLMKNAKPDAPPPDWLTEVAGPNAPAPGKQANVTVDLAPGTYLLLCFIPAPDGVPHAMKGMVRPLVVGGKKSEATLPAADQTLTLNEYGFTFARPLTAGTHTIRVKNAGAQPHEVELVKLAPGKTAQQVIEWVDKRNGPPPGQPLGGIVGLRPGTEAQFSADLEPGSYALICFVPDAKDGKPHFAHGMVQQFTIAR